MLQDLVVGENTNDVGGEATDAEYEVGYRRPPKAHRFQKGRSGNPAGAPKRKTLNMQAALEDALGESVSVRAGGQERRVSSLEAMMFTQMQSALRGDIGAVRRLMRLAKKTERWSDPRKIIGVVHADDPDREVSKALAEYDAAKAAGEDPWKKFGLEHPSINVTRSRE